MPYSICKTFDFESGHILSRHPGKCRFPHGHSRRVEVVVTADQLDANGMVCDFQAIKGLLKDFLETWDHALCLNTDDPHFAFYERAYGNRVIAFPHTDPTSEVMVKAVFDEMKRQLAGAGNGFAPGVRLARVRLTETNSSWAEYSA
ncbi:MAG TPA: 6-carboxytetrahydropterin synthase [Opitutaceae bacterium]|nr:6-carboxytetrahydropterin synthase [Opitutaceae bacterium]